MQKLKKPRVQIYRELLNAIEMVFRMNDMWYKAVIKGKARILL